MNVRIAVAYWCCCWFSMIGGRGETGLAVGSKWEGSLSVHVELCNWHWLNGFVCVVSGTWVDRLAFFSGSGVLVSHPGTMKESWGRRQYYIVRTWLWDEFNKFIPKYMPDRRIEWMDISPYRGVLGWDSGCILRRNVNLLSSRYLGTSVLARISFLPQHQHKTISCSICFISQDFFVSYHPYIQFQDWIWHLTVFLLTNLTSCSPNIKLHQAASSYVGS